MLNACLHISEQPNFPIGLRNVSSDCSKRIEVVGKDGVTNYFDLPPILLGSCWEPEYPGERRTGCGRFLATILAVKSRFQFKELQNWIHLYEFLSSSNDDMDSRIFSPLEPSSKDLRSSTEESLWLETKSSRSVSNC